MKTELSPTALALQDWGRPALLRQIRVGSEPPYLTSAVDREVTVIPQTLRINQFDALASLQDETRCFLVSAAELPPDHTWSDSQLILDGQPHRITTAENSESTGWILIETQLLTPLPAA
jgi:hypothetical protein